MARDLPVRIGHLPAAPCAHCAAANATRQAHPKKDVYKPSHVGRLLHMDVVGPFKPSAVGMFRYALVIVDDHSRFKFVRFMRRKSEALSAVRGVVAVLNAQLSQNSTVPVRVVGSLHTDNAGEFLSGEFREFLDTKGISQTTCPPYVHSLNGVAERAIRSIMENARAHMVASSCPIGFWPYAVEHAVDVLNRATGPPSSTCARAPSGAARKTCRPAPSRC